MKFKELVEYLKEKEIVGRQTPVHAYTKVNYMDGHSEHHDRFIDGDLFFYEVENTLKVFETELAFQDVLDWKFDETGKLWVEITNNSYLEVI